MELSVVTKVMLSSELSEAILTNLSMQDLLVSALRVNKAWNATITCSPTLQQHLYLAPITAPSTKSPGWTKNPLLVSKFPPWLNDIRETSQYFLNPKTFDQQESFHYGDNLGPYKRYNFTSIHLPRKSDLGSRWEAFCRPEASWRQMLVTQPPAMVLNVLKAVPVRKRWRRQKERREIEAEVGLRMAFLYDLAIKGIRCGAFERFGLQWNMFDVEEDIDAVEDGGLDDCMYGEELIERNDEKASVTLICMDSMTWSKKDWEKHQEQPMCKLISCPEQNVEAAK